ncbi:putative receptor-like protein kinase At4g00960 [Ananas comosus]|uniref:Receptor-like protein kinase At4g00960 n=1 Tax=Ananas comosus TaxID=4615 RepID=A0A6P5EJX3_ANACO|nr:putative receptor-like protein kinase At4g00960 [Ananas comosus]
MALVLFQLQLIAIISVLITTAFPYPAYSEANATLTYCSGDPPYKPTSPILSPTQFTDFLYGVATAAPTTADRSSSSQLPAGDQTIYAVAQCRFDASPSDCSACLNSSLDSIGSSCAASAVRYDLCLLRYDVRDLSLFDENEYTAAIFNATRAAAKPAEFERDVSALLSAVVNDSAAAGSRLWTGVMTNSSAGRSVYEMAQCIPELSGADCARCLRGALGRLTADYNGSAGMQVLRLSCAVRYDTYPFFDPSLPLPRTLLNGSAANSPSAPPPIVAPSGNNKHATKVVLIIAVTVGAGGAIVLFAICIYLFMGKVARDAQYKQIRSISFDLKTLCTATNNFAIQNKLGSGGAGMVYKGTLPDGQEIAVKRFSGASHQGITELGVIVLIAKLEHPNLAKLIGFCYEKMEMLLVCEYLPNKSLDNYLFDPNRRAQLDWRMRYMIIRGVCQGLLYLHEDSQLTIIHRDLKASNILLDKDMNPKIADFGLAKLLGSDRTHEITRKNAGTLGYMAPEYYNKGQFSKQSDVYSYGILVLEIVTGERNSEFEGSSDALYLSTYVWKHWRNGKGLDVVDKSLGNLYEQDEALKCIQIGLLCAQHDRAKRPSMSQVSSMLDGPNEISEQPCEPGYVPVVDNTTVISSPEQEQAPFNTYRAIQERETV